MSAEDPRPMFRDLSADDPDPEVTEIESLCINCHKNGMTRLLLTRIPYYKNVVLMSFSCEECGYENNEMQPGGEHAEMGIRWKLDVKDSSDLNRQVVKSDFTCVKIPELEFEIPAQSQKGEITTVEGIVSRAMAGLAQEQPRRREQHPDAAASIDEFLNKLQRLRDLDDTWTLVLEDISGNCFIENPEAPLKDKRCSKIDFKRTRDENHSLGIFLKDELEEDVATPKSIPSSLLSPSEPSLGSYERLLEDEVLQFHTQCPACDAPADTCMKCTDIPHFKQVVIMATTCDNCGHRTNEVKSGGGIDEKGVKFVLKVATREDFSRDILKSETCSMELPELRLEVGGRALGGRFTTAEGLLAATRAQLHDAGRDAPAPHDLRGVIDKLDDVLAGRDSITIVLDDPAGNSYVQSLSEDMSVPDDGLEITRYERTFDQNEELGLNDMKTENYEQDS